MTRVDKILFITLSNIGDVILTLPVLDVLRACFPESKITVMVGPRPKEIFEDNPCIKRLIIYDKHSRLKDKIKLFDGLKKERFDVVVDLRNSLFGALLPSKYKISPFLAVPKNVKHMRDRHLYKIQNSATKIGGLANHFGEQKSKIQILKAQKKSLYIKPEDEEYINKVLKENNISKEDKIIIISPGARSHIKRWAKDKFLELISWLVKDFAAKVILVGDKDDISITRYIAEQSEYPVLDLGGKTSITQLAYLLKKTFLLVSNDSAVLHLGSYMDVPTVAIFGPTDELKYGPWSDNCAVVQKDILCRPCQQAQCKYGTLECMALIKVEDVLIKVRELFNVKRKTQNIKRKDNLRRILIVRTDRIGDVLLSTPVIKALRSNYPNAYIAMMVSPYVRDIVEGNPYLDEVIIYDKDGRHNSWWGSLNFSLNLKKKRFDLTVILHPTNRVHLVTFFARIKRRIGYNRKLGFLLTDKIKHTKQLGEKHELEYNLDLLRYLGIEPKDKDLFMPLSEEAEKRVEDILRQKGIKETDRLLAIHPGASCVSKIWPQERFAEVADSLIDRYGFKVLIIAGPKDMGRAERVSENMRHTAINLAGRLSISQLASVLKRCQLFISNDSGPVHIASSVGTPVISIFGRNQKGLSPIRWGPTGKRDKILHKEVGCQECLAHNCIKDFACLKAITVDDVLEAADEILKT